jgi:serine/threonine-protein kinase
MTDTEKLPNRPDDPLRTQLTQALSGTYDLDGEIGRGGMGIVYEARDKRLKRQVAVKLLPPELSYRSDIRSRFLREAETAAQLSHPNIVPIYTVGEADHLVYFIMGYVGGGNLALQLRDRGVLTPDETRRLLREVADALAYAHQRQVVHRDIKPDNILLDRDTGRAVVTDFGIARALSTTTDTRLTTTGVAIGTPAYMSPEQSAGDRDADGRSDIYSLGVVGYQMLCGETPFIAPSTPAMLVKHLTEAPKPLIERIAVPQDLNDIIMRCLAKDPNDRFASAQDLVAALDGHSVSPPAQRAPARSSAFVSPATSNASAVPYPNMAFSGTPSNLPIERWEAPPVRKFRRKLVSFLATGSIFVVLGTFSSHFFFFIAGMWAVGLAGSYAKLWDKGYDWRDVFRQSSDRLFVDMVTETFDDTKALFDPTQRGPALERMRARRRSAPGLFTPNALPEAANAPRRPQVPRPTSITGLHTPLTAELAAGSPVVRDAAATRNDVHRLMNELSPNDRALLPDVSASADALLGRIEVLAATLDELQRADVPGMGDAIEREITQLESEANPLDEERSERRVRRLAQLRRQRISLRDIKARHGVAEEKLNRCVSAMQSMRMDLIRLRAGSRAYDSVTQIAEQAMQLGSEVDAVLYANDEIARVLSKKS